jgi:hypothetical protein
MHRMSFGTFRPHVDTGMKMSGAQVAESPRQLHREVKRIRQDLRSRTNARQHGNKNYKKPADRIFPGIKDPGKHCSDGNRYFVHDFFSDFSATKIIIFRNSDPFIEEIKKDGIVVFNSLE